MLLDRTGCLEQAALAFGVRVDVLAGRCKVSCRQLRLRSVLPARALSDPHPSSAHCGSSVRGRPRLAAGEEKVFAGAAALVPLEMGRSSLDGA